VDQIVAWIKAVFGIYGEALYESDDESIKIYEEAVYKIGYTLFTNGENMDEITSHEELIAKGIISQFYSLVWKIYGMPPIDNFGYQICSIASKSHKLDLLNSFKDAVIGEFEELKTNSLQSLQEYSPQDFKMKSVIMLQPVTKFKLKKMKTAGNLTIFEETKKEKIKIYLNGKKMTHLQSCRFYGEDFFGNKQYKSNAQEADEYERLAALNTADFFASLAKLSPVKVQYIYWTTLKKVGCVADLKSAEAILSLASDKYKFTEADRADVLSSIAAIIKKLKN
jgi:hypothetical protein